MEPRESEFSHGRGLQAPRRKGANWEPSVYEQGKAIQRTDHTDPNAVADPTAPPHSPSNTSAQRWIREPE